VSRRPFESAALSPDEDDTRNAYRGTAYGAGARGRLTMLRVTVVLVVLVVAAPLGARPEADPQPVSLAANKPTQASPMAMPSDVVLVEMTRIGLLAGNYPFVTARFSEETAVFEAPREQAPLRLETVDTEGGLAALAGSWDALVRAMSRPSPFLLHCWLVEWWRHYGEGSRLAVEVAFRGDKLVGALPLITFSRHGLRVGTFIGARQSMLADVLVAEGEGQEVVEALVDRVLASEHDYVDLFGLSDQGRLAALGGTRSLELFQRIEAPVLDISDGWDAAYRAKTNSRKRSHHNHRRRQLAQLGEVELIHARTLAEHEPTLEHAFRLHELRWQGRPDGSGFVTATGKQFTRAVVKELTKIDATRVVLTKVGGRPVAFCWYFVLEGKVYLHRLAFDPAYSRFSPGIVNALDTLRLAAREGATRAEFLGGAERYKVELADGFEPLHLGLGLPGSARGRAAAAARAEWLRLRRRGKSSGLARKVYYGSASVRRRLMRQRDVLRPSGVRQLRD
jgi:CelD/BcsL family acetyltransferase involved in cellulose biosynthesis